MNNRVFVWLKSAKTKQMSDIGGVSEQMGLIGIIGLWGFSGAIADERSILNIHYSNTQCVSDVGGSKSTTIAYSSSSHIGFVG